ncbi:uncharacterized protein LOC123519898 [Portunus trituberculatus]|uniref:uncharacterized protein LOC123519898 n=1 Tax=Portunus trituberculatus TaxID=210409 RepID=UPI001E1CCD27|nr:uncharacterized protein LOC123519898 [Portunus trituberculatus]XP_045137483.1 uncharacterized protein LOC123519898 [Portunus trituberculatus]XP_045137484.1 uncharacterized protein LOC123519898 [Portunus trituberculatus]XP_045137485.1 uncharacterized protein LOC123519898 [Portunus trituberculatus]
MFTFLLIVRVPYIHCCLLPLLIVISSTSVLVSLISWRDIISEYVSPGCLLMLAFPIMKKLMFLPVTPLLRTLLTVLLNTLIITSRVSLNVMFAAPLLITLTLVMGKAVPVQSIMSMADSDVKGREMPEGSEPEWKNWFAAMMERMDKMSSEIKQEASDIKQETSAIVMRMDLMREEMLTAIGEARQFTVEHSKRLRQDLTEEFKEELVAVRQQCEGRTGVAESVVGSRPCPEVVDTGSGKTVIGEEVVAVQDLPVADRQLCGVTGHSTTPRGPVMCTIMVGGVEKLPAFVADMEEPCLVGLDSLVQSAASVDSGRMQMQVYEEMLPLILEDAAEQVESPVTSSDVKDERLELHC